MKCADTVNTILFSIVHTLLTFLKPFGPFSLSQSSMPSASHDLMPIRVELFSQLIERQSVAPLNEASMQTSK